MLDDSEHPRDGTVTWPRPDAAGASAGAPTLPSRWVPVRLLGVGGQAGVWEVEDRELGERVAVKVFRSELSEQSRERLRREVRLGRALSHPGLVRVYELIEGGSSFAVAMELVSGESVASALEREGALPVERVVEVARQVLEALAYVHAQGVVHRDVKPSNLLLDGEGRVRLADLGLARRLEDELSVTQTAMAVGTPHYMAPEQIRGERATAASDLYALGVSLYQMVTGRTPFRAESAFEVANLHLRAKPEDPRRHRAECPAWLARFVLRLLEKRPDDRYADATEALTVLENRRVRLSPRLRKRIAAGGFAALCAVVALTVAYRSAENWSSILAVRVEADDRRLTGIDDRGRTAWQFEMAASIRSVKRVDIDGDGLPEIVVCASDSSLSRADRKTSEIVVLTKRGRLVTRYVPELALDSWPYDFPLTLAVSMVPLDIDRDGLPELIFHCRQVAFYPEALIVYWPRGNAWQPLALHSGYITQVRTVPGLSPPRLRIAGINNRLGMLPVVGEIEVVPPWKPGPQSSLALLGSPEMDLERSGSARWVNYAVLPQPTDAAGLATELSVSDGDGGTSVTVGGHVTRLDRWGNLADGPNDGLDLAAERSAFFFALRVLTPEMQPMSPVMVRQRVATARAACSKLLREPQYGAVLSLYGARALARSGEIRSAIAMLREAEAVTAYEDLSYRLAHLLALAGDTGGGRELLAPLLETRKTPRAYDANQLLLRIAIEERDVDGFAFYLARLIPRAGRVEERYEELASALRARANLWWDKPTEIDVTVRPWSFAPEATAVACLARWRLGRCRVDDADAMQRFVDETPDALAEGELARAAALLAAGRPREAASVLEAFLPLLDFETGDDFSNRQLLDLARGIYVKALLAAGDRDGAVAEARRVRPTLRDGLLPAILVDEVLQEAGASQR